MEIENALYRIHERVLSNDFPKLLARYFCVYFSTLAGFLTLSVFLYANIMFKDTSYCLKNSYETFKEHVSKQGANFSEVNYWDIKVISLMENVEPTEFYENYWKFNDSSNNYSVKGEENSGISDKIDKVYAELEYTATLPLIVMNSDMRKTHNFTQYHLFLDHSCYATNAFSRMITFYFIGLDNIIINEILYIFQDNDFIFVRNIQSNDKYVWTQEDLGIYYWKENFAFCFFTRIFSIMKILLGIFMLSNITSIYIKMTIICAPVFVLIMMDCCLGERANDVGAPRLYLFRAFPWVGIYLYALLYNRKPKKYLIFAFLLLLFFFYFVYLGSYYLWTFLLFHKPIPPGTDENFYVLVAFIEFCSLIFLRTRSSLKFFPKIIVSLLFMYCYYVNNTAFGFYSLGFYAIVYFGFAVFGLILDNFEIPALSWNPSFHYTPSLEKPRTLYFPLFSLSNYHDLPQLWSLFYPLYDRSTFTQAQMALIDRNFVLLNNTLQTSINNINGLNMNNVGEIELQEGVINNNYDEENGRNNNNNQNRNPNQNNNNRNANNVGLEERLLNNQN